MTSDSRTYLEGGQLKPENEHCLEDEVEGKIVQDCAESEGFNKSECLEQVEISKF